MSWKYDLMQNGFGLFLPSLVLVMTTANSRTCLTETVKVNEHVNLIPWTATNATSVINFLSTHRFYDGGRWSQVDYYRFYLGRSSCQVISICSITATFARVAYAIVSVPSDAHNRVYEMLHGKGDREMIYVAITPTSRTETCTHAVDTAKEGEEGGKRRFRNALGNRWLQLNE